MTASKLSIKIRRLVARLRKDLQWYFGRQKTTYVWDRVPHYKRMWQKAAEKTGLTLVELSDDVWDLQNDAKETEARINNCYVELDDPVTLYVAGNKGITYQLLSAADLPVSPFARYTLDKLDVMESFISDHDGPFVVKPASGTGSGIGVTTHLHTEKECLAASILASLYCKEIIVERFVVGEVYRLLFINNEFINGVRRTGLRVEGDGESTIEQLDDAGRGGTTRLDDIDYQTTLALQGMSGTTVLPKGQQALIKTVAENYQDTVEIRTVYTDDVTNTLCPEIVATARKASEVLRSEFCGVDLILLDPSKPLGNGNGVIGEINTTPGLHHHYNLPGSDPEADAAHRVLTYLLSSRRRA